MTKIIKSKYRPEIDGLRALAVICVIINHFNKELLPSGYLGVDIFFVISGYVITSSLSGRKSKSFWELAGGFYERRLKRIIPALISYTLIISLLLCLFCDEPVLLLRTGITSLFGISNIYLLRQSTNYFADSTSLNPFTHTWSLSVEEQFYLVFPLLVWITGLGKQSKNSYRNLCLTLSLASISSLIAFIYIYHVNQSAAYFLMPTRVWEISIGCLVFIGLKKSKKIVYISERIPSDLVIFLILGIMLLPIYFAVPATILIALLTSTLITSLQKGSRLYILLTNKFIVYLGVISYSLYLWHWGVISISRWTIGVTKDTLLFQLILTFLLASFSYYLIEKPLRQFKWNYKLSSKLIFLIIQFFASFTLFLLSKEYIRKSIYLGENSQIPYGQTKSSELSRKCSNSLAIEECILGTRDNSIIYLVGDSHALALFPMIEEIYYLSEYSVIGAFKGNTPFPSTPKLGNETEQKEHENLLLEKVKPGDIVIISNANYLKSNLSIFKKNLLTFSNKLNLKKVNLVLMVPLPVYKTSSVCSNQWFQKNCEIKESRGDLESSQSEMLKIYKYVERESNLKEIIIFNSFDLFCKKSKKYCTSKDTKGNALFYDFKHINVNPSRSLAEPLLNQIKNLSIGNR